MKPLIKTLGAIVVLAFALPAQAASISYTLTKSSSLTDWEEVFTFAKFNSELGTLLSVEATVSSSATTSVTVTNTGDADSSGSVRTEMSVWLTDPDGLLAGGGTFPQVDVLITDAPYTLVQGQSTVLGPFTVAPTNTVTYSSADILSLFSGTSADTIGLTLSTLTEAVLSNAGGNTIASQQTQADGVVTITYNYDVVPEPSTYALLGVGLLMLLIFRRRLGKA